MTNQLVYKGHYHTLRKHNGSLYENVTKIYSKKGLAVNNTPSSKEDENYKTDSVIIEYELVPTGRKFNSESGELIE